MVLMLVLMASLTLGASSAEEIDRQQLIRLIDAAQENNCRDVGFDYEGRQFAPGKSGMEDMKSNYTGSISRRADGANLVDLYYFGKSTGIANHSVVAVFNETTEFSSRQADQKNARIKIAKQGPLEYAGTGNYREIWLNDLVKKFARSQYLYEFEGVRRLDGEECVVGRFRLVYDNSTPKNETVSDVFWIDLNRGGHVVRYERRFQGENLATLTTVRLGRVEASPGKKRSGFRSPARSKRI